MHLVVGVPDRTEVVLANDPPHCPAVYLPELLKVVLDLVLRNPRLVVLWDFNIHVKAMFSVAQVFMVPLTTISLCWL